MKTKDRWVRSRTAVYNIGYHIIWCPKYRKNVLTGDVATRAKQLLYQKADELGCKIHSLEVMPDHIHMFIKTPPTIGVHFLVQQMKGITARNLRAEFKYLKSGAPCMWTRSYYVESIGSMSEENIKRYIENQQPIKY